MLIVQLREQFFFLLPIVSLFEKNHDSSSIMFLVFKNQLITKENNNLIDFFKGFFIYFTLYNFSIFNFPRVPRRDRPNRSGPGTSTGGTTGPVSVQGKYLSFKNSKFYKELYCVMFFQ